MPGERFNRIASYALSRPEAYLIVGVTFAAVIVAIIGGWPGWVTVACIAGGLVMLGLLVLDSLSDPNTEREASIADVDAGQIGDRELRAKVDKALEYVRGAQRLAREDTSGVLGAASEELPQMEQAARLICQMGLRLQAFRADRLIQQDLADLRQQEKGRATLNKDQRAQLDTLERLDQLVHTAEQEIDSTVANLGRSYAEMQSIKVTPEFRGRAKDALDELKASAQRLSDLSDGYDEAYGKRTVQAINVDQRGGDA